jgi:hypothetical protein
MERRGNVVSDFIQEDLNFEAQNVRYDYEQEIYKRNAAIHEAGLKNWEILNEGQVDQEKHFDKISMTVAAGSFGISFAFIDKVIPLSVAVYKPVLAAAWACFGVCILLLLVGYRVSSIVFRAMSEEEKRNIENLYEDKPAAYKKRNTFLNVSEICNNLTLLANAGGIICLILFVFLNF